VHTLLGAFSLTVFATSAILDAVGLATRRPAWGVAARGGLTAGLAAGAAAGIFAVAAVAGARPGSPHRRAAHLRAAAHLGALSLFAGALVLRRGEQVIFPSTAALVLSLGGILLGAIAAWLTAELGSRVEG
jgi:uncharacterized membrane protein